jgi:ring-1,2-phenylacetyl-CoA epoxidase subunit PaaD
VSAPDVAEVRRAVMAVADPELPPVTIGMLGMVHDLAVAPGGRVEVVLLPTYTGCPATEMIERDVVSALAAVPGVTDVRVRFTFDPPWSADRIDEEGRRRLRGFGITPPGGPVTGAPRPDGRPTLPLAQTQGETPGEMPRETTGETSGVAPRVAAGRAPRPCPYCGSTDTVLDSPFGPTPCRDVRSCRSCRQPFEAFKA